MLRVAFDVTALLAGETGVARYVRGVGEAARGCGVELVPFAVGRGPHPGALPDGTRRMRVPLRVVSWSWARSGPPSAERMAPRTDVVHTPDLVPPPTRRPLVVTLHDLAAVDRPDLHPPRSVAAQQQQLRAARERASVVICVSRATADAAVAHGVAPSRIVVVPNGVTPLPRPDASGTPDGAFLLAVGSLNARKGFDALVAAFAEADLPDDLRLVFAGEPGWNGTSVHEAIARHGLASRVACVGRVSDAQLASLYERCTAVCVPSHAEGFGLPILEAAAAGAAVVASDLPVFRELADAVALFAPPGDVPAWAGALERIATDAALRDAAEAKGRAVASWYTWERTAKLTVGAYEQAARAS